MDLGSIVAHLKLDISDFSGKIKTAMSEVSGFDDNFSSLKKTGESLTTIGSALSVGVTAPIMSMGAAAIKSGSDFQYAMSNVAALSGATGKDLQKLEDTAKHLGATTQFSATQAADALGYMALAGWDVEQSTSALPGVLNLAASSGMDLASASDLVTDYLSAFGEEADQAGRMADVLAYAQANSNTTTAGLGEAFKNCAVNANSFGMDIEQTTAVLGKMADQGLKGSEAGTALSAVIRDMTSKMKDGKIAIGDTSVSIVDANGNFRNMADIVADVEKATDGMSESERMAALQSTFTADSIKAMTMLLNTGSGDIDEFTEALYGSTGAAEKMADVMNDNLKGKVNELKSAFEGLCINIFESLEPALSKIVEWLTKVVSWFANLPQPVLAVITVLAGVAAAIGPVLLIIGKLISAIETMKLAWTGIQLAFLAVKTFITGSLIPALSSLWTFLLTNPVGWVILAIMALVAAFVLLWKNCEGFRNFWINLWNDCKKFFQDFVNSNKDLLKALGENFKQVWEGIKNVFKGNWDMIKGIFTGDFELVKQGFAQWKEGMLQIGQGLWEGLKNIWQLGCNFVKELFTAWFNSLSEEKQQFITDLLEGFTQAWEGLKTIFKGALDFIKALLDGDFQAMGEAIKTIWEGIKEYFKGVWDMLKTWWTQLWTDLSNAVQEWGPKILQWFQELPGKIGEWLLQVLVAIGEWAVNLIQSGIQAGSDFIQGIGEWFQQLPGKIDEWLANAILAVGNWALDMLNKGIEAGTNLVNGVSEWLTQLPDKVSEWCTTAVTKVTEWATNLFTEGQNAGQSLIDGVGEWLTQLPDKVWEWLTNAYNKVIEWKDNLFNGGNEAGKNLNEGAGQELSQTGTKTSNWLLDSWNAAKEWAQGMGEEGNKAGTETTTKTGEALANLKSTVQPKLDEAKQAVEQWGTQVSTAATKCAEEFKTRITQGFENAKTAATNALNNMKSAISNWASDLSSRVTQAANNFKTQLTNGFNNARAAAVNALNNMKSAISSWASDMASKASQAASNFKSRLTSGLQSAVGAMKSIGSSIARGLANGISAGLSWVTNAAKNLASKAVAAAKSALNINSPSKVFRDDVGSAIPEGLALGVKLNASEAIDSVTDMTNSLIDSVNLKPLEASVNSTNISNRMHSNNSRTLSADAIAIISALGKMTGLLEEKESGVNISIDTVNNNTEEDVNELMIRIASQMRLNNLGKGVR